MKKYLIFILFLPFIAFADNESISDEQLRKDIVGLWSMVEKYGQANVVHYDDKGVYTLHLFKCDNDNKSYEYKGYERNNYKIEDGNVITFLDDNEVAKLKVDKLTNKNAVLTYDMPNHQFDKIELFYAKSKHISPLCAFMIIDYIAEIQKSKNN